MSDRSVVIRWGLRWLLVVALALTVPAVAQAAQTVTNTNDSGAGSLRAAIAPATDGNTINFDSSLSGQTITLTNGALMVTHSLTISGPGAGSLTIDANDNDSVFDIEIPPVMPPATTSVTISGLTITGGQVGAPGGGGIFANSVDTVTLTGDTITCNKAIVSASSAGGGGVYVTKGALNLNNTKLTNNTVSITGANTGDSGGGGLYVLSGNITVTGSDVSNNSVVEDSSSGDSGGGGIYSDFGDVEVSGSTVRNNSDQITSSPGGDDGGVGSTHSVATFLSNRLRSMETHSRSTAARAATTVAAACTRPTAR